MPAAIRAAPVEVEVQVIGCCNIVTCARRYLLRHVTIMVALLNNIYKVQLWIL